MFEQNNYHEGMSRTSYIEFNTQNVIIKMIKMRIYVIVLLVKLRIDDTYCNSEPDIMSHKWNN